MTDSNDPEELRLPEDLRALDAELASIRYEERPSFRPELRAELAGAWAAGETEPPSTSRRLAAAAVLVFLLIGAGVPSARASLVRLVGVLTVPADVETTAPLEALELAPVALAEVEPVAQRLIAPVPLEAPVPELAVESAPPEAPVPPSMLDRERAEILLERAYPEYLQREGVGGVVWLRAWIDTDGSSNLTSVARSSGVDDLDRAALDVAPFLRFQPALQAGGPVATWIQFPVVFEPEPRNERPVLLRPTEEPLRLPTVHPDDRWELQRPLDLDALPPLGASSAELTEVEAALVDALGDPLVRRSLGPVESILSGIAPSGRPPDEWRASATAILERAIERTPANPVPLLALGRIRLRQGLRTDARMLFEQGLQTAILSEGEVSPAVVAELHFERGRLIRDAYLASHGVGRVRAEAFGTGTCAQARFSGGAASGYASVERLLAWNYLCPSELKRIFEAGFEEGEGGLAELSLMMGSFRAAIDAEPGHPASNVGLLTALAEEGRWEEVLAGARRFARRSGGHPDALLFAGLALTELGRPDEAEAHFAEALERLPEQEAAGIRDVSLVIDVHEVEVYRRLWGAEREAWEESFWRTRDRTPTTVVNERRLEHLARATYARFRYGGTTSDTGEVWVRFGGPHRIHVVDGGAGTLTEFWDYGSGPDITFVRRVASQKADLTPEGRAYVDDLGKIFPPQ